jgi:hypothetical protein
MTSTHASPLSGCKVRLSEARTRVEFLAAEEPDCSSQQLVVRVTKQPTNGKLEVEERKRLRLLGEGE